MRSFALASGVNLTFPAGATVFQEGDPVECMYVVQSGKIEILIHGKTIDTCQAGEALGFMSVVDGRPRTSTARVAETALLSAIDRRKFYFMVDEVPYFARYVMESMAHRIRGMRQVI
ncbi:MAG: cyclic nucleotide-binding domain-containing protein [Methylobacteriaceae bacterium]|nr:cyclic nucleotide-binding domain-containing protein [Methylobacteriaceae bacterium]